MSADSSRGLAPLAKRISSRTRPAVWASLVMLFWGAGVRGETLTLADCLRETVEHNPLIVEKRLAIEEAGGQRMVFRSRAYPSLLLGGLGGEQGRQTTENIRVNVAGANGKSTTINELSPRPSTFFLVGSEALYQPIFDAAIPASWRRGNVGLAVARSNFLVTATAELYAARLQFYNALFQQEDGALLRGISHSLAGNFEGETQLLNVGLANRQAVLAAQVQQANFAPQLPGSIGTLRSDLTTLLQTMGRPLGPGALPEASCTLSGAWEDGPLAFDAAAVAKEARALRPDLQALRDMIRSYAEDANIARGGYYPLVRIYVTGELLPQDFVQGQRTTSVRPEDNTQVSEISPGVREDWNVIDTGTVRGNVNRLESLRGALAISLHHLEQDIPSELDLARAQWTAAAKERELYEKNVGLASETLETIKSGIAGGTNSQLEFLDAQTGVLSTQTGLLAARFRMSVARAEYDRVIGGYLRFVTEDKQKAATVAPK